jgi:hypothetical protein
LSFERGQKHMKRSTWCRLPQRFAHALGPGRRVFLNAGDCKNFIGVDTRCS